MSEDIEIIEKTTKDGKFTGLRLYLYLPVTLGSEAYRLPPVTSNGVEVSPDNGVAHVRGKFMHHPGDDDSAAITFWGKRDLRTVLRKMIEKLDEHYGAVSRDQSVSEGAREALEELHPGIDLE